MHLLRILFYLLFFLSPIVGLGQNPQPNIILLLADDLGYAELGVQRPENVGDIPTPHIDSIATAGVRFTDGYVTAAYCSASRAGMMTGRYQTRFGYEFNPTGYRNEDPDFGLPASQKTIADQLQLAGYTTSLIGKWHLGGTAAYHPFRRGFDEFFGFTHEGHYFVPAPYKGVTTMLRRKTLPGGLTGRWFSKNERLVYTDHMGYNEPDYDANNPILRGGQPVAEREYLTDAFTREAVDFINRASDRPFFLYVAYNAVHSPLQGADKYMKKFQHIDDIHQVAPECSLFLATTTAGCHRAGEQWIAAGEGKTLVGQPDTRTAPSWFGTWQKGIPSLEWCSDISERLVEKVAINASINPLTAVHGVKNGALLSEPYQAKADQIIAEVSSILIEMGYSQLASRLNQTVRTVVADTAENTSSMLSDVMAGRRTEADSIVGWLLQQTEQKHPALQAMLNQLNSLEPAS